MFITAFRWLITETQSNILCQAAHKSWEMFVVFLKKTQAVLQKWKAETQTHKTTTLKYGSVIGRWILHFFLNSKLFF